MSEVYYIDDLDGAVTYSGAWQSSTDMRSHDNTIHFSNSVNSQASLTFTGVSVMAYGVVRAGETPQSSYTLDGGNPTVLQSTSRAISQYGVLLYTSPSLRNGQHSLVITNLGNGTTFIDYFAVMAGAASTSTSTSTTIMPSPITLIIPGMTSISTTSSSSPRSNPTRSTSLGSFRSSDSGSSNSPGGSIPSAISASSDDTNFNSAPEATPSDSSRRNAAIIGSAAALAIVAGFLIVFLWLRRQRRRKKEFESWIISSFSGGTVVPTAAFLPVARRISEGLSLPPRYAMSEPPAYDANVGPAARITDSQRSGGFGKLEEGSVIITQSSDGRPASTR